MKGVPNKREDKVPNAVIFAKYFNEYIFYNAIPFQTTIKTQFYNRSLTGTNQLQWWGWCHRLAVRQRSAQSPLWPDQPGGFRPLRYLQQWLWCCIIKKNINHILYFKHFMNKSIHTLKIWPNCYDLPKVHFHVVNLGDKDGCQGFIQCCSIHVDRGSNGQHESSHAFVDVVVLLQAFESNRKSGRAGGWKM